MPAETESTPAAIPTLTISRPQPRRRRRFRFRWLFLLLLILVPPSLWAAGVRPDWLTTRERNTLPTVKVDRGDVRLVVVESGALESANNATIKCQVEALTGLVGGSSGSGGSRGGGGGSNRSSSSVSSSGGASGGATAGAATAAAAGTAKAAATAANANASGSMSTVTQAPTIQSFSMKVQPHVPLRPATSMSSAASAAPAGGGRGSGMGGDEGGERAGSTRILTLLPEGSPVKAGDVVCTLDSATFEDELRSQLIRVAQAEAWVAQAREILAVAKISLREYRDGIYPKDLLAIENFTKSCKIELEKAKTELDWSEKAYKKGLIAEAQLQSAEFAHQRAQIALREAQGMRSRLIKYSAPRLITNLSAKIDAITSDLLAQEAAYKLETDRQKRLEKNIAACTLRAPREGIVVYSNQSNGWGRVTDQIIEGATVREGQAIVDLPDPKRMRVRVKINESKVSFVEVGQNASIRLDAFPRQALLGRVTEVTAIPSPVNGPISDVKVYFAIVEIEKGFAGLRPGLSAEVTFFVDSHQDVTRIPLRAIRWQDGNAFAALPSGPKVQWQRLKLGILNPSHAEVLSGLEPGDRVIADPENLPPPDSSPEPAPKALARANPRPRQ